MICNLNDYISKYKKKKKNKQIEAPQQKTCNT